MTLLKKYVIIYLHSNPPPIFVFNQFDYEKLGYYAFWLPTSVGNLFIYKLFFVFT